MSEKMATAHVNLTNAGELRDSVVPFHSNIARLFTVSQTPQTSKNGLGESTVITNGSCNRDDLIDTEEDSPSLWSVSPSYDQRRIRHRSTSCDVATNSDCCTTSIKLKRGIHDVMLDCLSHQVCGEMRGSENTSETLKCPPPG
jgi:hypothetical protein